MQDIETLVRTVYTMFSRSSVKKQGLQAIAQAYGHNLISFKVIHDVRWLSRHFAIQALVLNYAVLLDYCKEQGTRDLVAVFCVAKLESMQIKDALFVLNDIPTKLSDLSRTFNIAISLLWKHKQLLAARLPSSRRSTWVNRNTGV